MSTAIVKTPKERKADIERALTQAMPNLKALLPAHVKPDALLRSVTSAVSKAPELLQCTPVSIVLATAQAASLGLLPNTPLGLAYLVAYKNTATLIPGYRGLSRLAVQSGEVQSVMARIVYSKDAVEIRMGTNPGIDHSPSMDADRGTMVGVYAVAKLRTGETEFEWMSIKEVEAIRDRSKAAKEGPWVTDFEEMARKTAVRRLCKYLPLSEEKLGRALELQAAAESGNVDFSDVIDAFGERVDEETGDVVEARQSEPSRSQAMADRLNQKAAS